MKIKFKPLKKIKQSFYLLKRYSLPWWKAVIAFFPIFAIVFFFFGRKLIWGEKVFSAIGQILSVEKTENGIIANTSSAKIEVSVFSGNCLHINVLPNGNSSQQTLVLSGKTPDYVAFKTDITSDPIEIETEKIRAELSRKNCTIKIFNDKDDLLLEEKFAETIDKNIFRFEMPEESSIYGVEGFDAWEFSGSGMLRKGYSEMTAGSQGNCGAPFFWSSAGFGVLVDTDGGLLNVFSREIMLRNISKRNLEYFVVAGNPYEIMKEINCISGASPLFPKWSSGFMNTEWGIDQKELVSLVNEYRQKQIPLDAFILDFDWKAWSEDNYGEWRWNDSDFPDGSSGKLARMLLEKGVKLGGILKPRIHVNTAQGRYARQHGYFWPEKKDYKDYFSGEQVNDLNFEIDGCRKWFWEKLIPAYDSGIKAFWNDEADEGFDNFQFLDMQRSLYDGQRSHDNERVWSLNRNFYLGAQRYAYALWSGDIRSTFKSMKMQRERMLSAVNLGAMRWSMDTGGFSGMPSDENYARWMQFAAFCPIFRVHGTMDLQRQPWVHDANAETAAVNAIRLRYSLLPYIYSYENQYRENGVYLVRPLFWNNPDDEKLANYIDGWYFGDFMAVYPVVDEGEKKKEIYLPKGEWINYFTGEKVSSGVQHLSVDNLSWSDIPLFIKAGAIIPSSEVLQFVGEHPLNYLYVNIFPSSEETSFELYDDDGKTYNYEKGEWFTQKITQKKKAGSVSVHLYEPSGSYLPEYGYYVLKIYNEGVEPSGIINAASYEALLAGEEGWVRAKDARGSFVAIKIRSGEDRTVVLK